MPEKKTASFMRSLCLGEIEEEIVLPFPEPTAPERETLAAISQTLKAMLGGREKDFRAWDVAGEFPPSFIAELKDAGLFGLVIPEVHGGMGLTWECRAHLYHRRAMTDRALLGDESVHYRAIAGRPASGIG